MKGVVNMGIPILKNGSVSETSHLRNRNSVSISETCGFDSLLMLIMQGVSVSQEFKTIVKESDIYLGNLCLQILLEGKILNKHYVKRYEFLKGLTITKKEFNTRYLKTYNCRSNVAHLSEFLFRKLSPSHAMTKIVSNVNPKPSEIAYTPQSM